MRSSGGVADVVDGEEVEEEKTGGKVECVAGFAACTSGWGGEMGGANCRIVVWCVCRCRIDR